MAATPGRRLGQQRQPTWKRSDVLHDIVVDPGTAGWVFGRRLLEARLPALRERGARQVVLSTAARNEAAQRLFERAGSRRTMIEMMRDE